MSYLFLAILFQSSSVILGKFASLSINSFSPGDVITNSYYLLSIVCLFFQALVWQIVLKKVPLLRAYYCMSGVNIVVFFSSFLIFKESVRMTNIIGIIIIIGGLTVLTRPEKSE